MPRCDTCKHAANDHITYLLYDEDSEREDESYPCFAFGCGCENYEPELIDKYN